MTPDAAPLPRTAIIELREATARVIYRGLLAATDAAVAGVRDAIAVDTHARAKARLAMVSEALEVFSAVFDLYGPAQ